MGTAFPIGGKFYITAGHVLEGIDVESIIALGTVLKNYEWRPVPFTKYEINRENDIAIIEVEHETNDILPWEEKINSNLTNIILSGYPHALDVSDKAIYRRDFKGYIITHRPFNKLKGKPDVYELSTPCPRGISGSYILNDDSGKICGIIIGNTKTDIDIIYETEELIEKGDKLIYHKTETSSYGVGICSKSIMNCQFKLLKNKTLKQYLTENKLLEITKDNE